MRKWLWIAPLVLLAGCSKNQTGNPQAAQPAPAGSTQAAASTTAPASYSPSAPDLPARAATAPLDPLTPASAPHDGTAAPEPVSMADTVIPAGTALRVRLEETVSTRNNNAGDGFEASLTSPVRVNGRTVLAAGTRVHGHVMTADDSGRMKGRARLVLALDSFDHGGKRYRIRTGAIARVSQSHKKRNIIGIGGGSAIGAAIGAIAGGGTLQK